MHLYFNESYCLWNSRDGCHTYRLVPILDGLNDTLRGYVHMHEKYNGIELRVLLRFNRLKTMNIVFDWQELVECYVGFLTSSLSTRWGKSIPLIIRIGTH